VAIVAGGFGVDGAIRPMRILVTNDDGVHAEGLEVLERLARELSDDIWVVAPEADQSGVAHSLSLNDPLRLREIHARRFAVKGTPTDCVIMAVRSIMTEMPDLVLSGVNRGHNLAEDVIYSGTVAGAMEGTILGIPSVALSQGYGPGGRANVHWDCALTHGPSLLRKLIAAGFAPGVLFNVNFPNCSPAEAKGIALTSQGRRDNNLLRIEPRHDGRGIPYYWVGVSAKKTPPAAGTDLDALAQGKISITPLRIDLTDAPTLTRLAATFS
jgi:5'-nucleotidase